LEYYADFGRAVNSSYRRLQDTTDYVIFDLSLRPQGGQAEGGAFHMDGTTAIGRDAGSPRPSGEAEELRGHDRATIPKPRPAALSLTGWPAGG
jgi:hypothetical protein